MFKKIAALVLKAVTTPAGKAVEHAAVAGVSVAVSLIIAAQLKGNLDLTTVQAAGVAGFATFLAGVRAYLKALFGTQAPAA